MRRSAAMMIFGLKEFVWVFILPSTPDALMKSDAQREN